jgi:two-component system sensor histidine kinase UhpB
VAKHAAASRVKILLQHQAGSIVLLLEDDGVGLAEISGKGLGLQGMSERVKSLGGTIEIGLGESGGVRISASIPLQELP